MSWQGAVEIVGIVFALALLGGWGIASIIESNSHARAIRRRLAQISEKRSAAAADETAWGEVVQLHPEARFRHHGGNSKL